LELLDQGLVLTAESVGHSIDIIKAQETASPSEVLSDTLVTTHTGKPIRPKTAGQKRYVDVIRDNTIVFSIGPAGSGKTYLAVAMAIRALKTKEVSRIVLTRPAVEAGERLGFLPGDLAAKIDPYLKPLYDALYEMLEPNTFQRHVEQGTIEIAPLAFMRGRTLNDAFIILDEAQNTTPEQMKMFLTRLGFGSKAVVTGDITQVDLPKGSRSGLIVVEEILNAIAGVAFNHLDARDVVRHKIVQDIVEAYRIYTENGR
jgi:phosphate starvation-inducible protein PhoH and related proteins